MHKQEPTRISLRLFDSTCDRSMFDFTISIVIRHSIRHIAPTTMDPDHHLKTYAYHGVLLKQSVLVSLAFTMPASTSNKTI